MDKRIKEAFTYELRALITQGERVQVDGLGEFSVTHQKQNQVMDDDGRVMLAPPADVIHFSPEKK